MFSFYMPSHLYIGEGSLKKLSEIDIPGSKGLIVTTSGKSVKKYGYLNRVQAFLEI